jgi:hypothetical protein
MPTTASRPRTLLAAILSIAAVVSLVAVPSGWATAATDRCEVMQVVAHEDDDLLFMNPDIDGQIQAGGCSVTVFVTAGNGEPTVRTRQRGIQDAYRWMANVADLDDQDEWDGQVLDLGGTAVEEYVLRDRPSVKLVFMNLDDPPFTDPGHVDDLWRDPDAVSRTRIPCAEEHDSGVDCQGLVTRSFGYNRAELLNRLAAIMDHYGPTTIRLQDTTPDARYTEDHKDHIATARFAEQAAGAHGNASGMRPNLVYYRDYNIQMSQPNLVQWSHERKQAAFVDEYVPLNELGRRYIDVGWLDRTYYRWARGTSWLGHNADGRLQAFAVRGGEVFTWWETPAGGWSGPLSLGSTGGGLFPAISVVDNADGRMEIFVRTYDHHIVTKYQSSPNGTWYDFWTDLGNPNDALGNVDQVGVPIVTTNGDGRIQIFIKNGGGGLSSRWQTSPNGVFGPWTDFGADGIQDPVAATVNNGRIEVFASSIRNNGNADRILRWFQPTPNGKLVWDGSFPAGTDGDRPASPPSVAVNADGRLEVHYRARGTADVKVIVQDRPDGGWRTQIVDIGGQGGIGEPAVTTSVVERHIADARIFVVTRNGGGGVSVNRQAGPNQPYGQWQDLGGLIVDYPVAAQDTGERVNVFGLGLDGRLYRRRQTAASVTADFGPWTLVG